MPDIDKIIAWENGELDTEDTMSFFAQLIEEGTAWTLQGIYGRTAEAFIDAGLISRDGEVDWNHFEELRFQSA